MYNYVIMNIIQIVAKRLPRLYQLGLFFKTKGSNNTVVYVFEHEC